MVDDTKPISVCSNCGEMKNLDKFIKNRNVCKDCSNVRRRQLYSNITLENETEHEKKCNICEVKKPSSSFSKKLNQCKDCHNSIRREKYSIDDEHRKKLIKAASEFKHNKVVERANIREKVKEELNKEIGEENAICKYCNKIQPKTRFRYNRLKCRDCERDEPIDKFKRSVRSRIYISLNNNKTKHTVEYLGCSVDDYLKWMSTNNLNYTIENRGKEWHIDHVIPLSKFNLDDEEEQLLAFNWRNTMPLSVKENLSKNNKIIKSQIEQHYKTLQQFHKENNIEFPQKYIDLFAKHLVDGDSLKLSLPLTTGNFSEELG
jgi:hypothetical protein